MKTATNFFCSRILLITVVLYRLINPDQLVGQYAQEQGIKIYNISIGDDLSQSTVNCILQDSKGFMWFGTQDGLNRYDGYRFIIYKYEPDDPNSLSDNNVLSICEDKFGGLWIGTYGGGLNHFDPSSGRFTCYQYDPEKPNSLSYNRVTAIIEDSSGNLWIGTLKGLNRFDPTTKSFTRYRHNPENANSLIHDQVNTVMEDLSGCIWIGTSNGLDRFDRSAERFTHYRHDPENANSPGNDLISTVCEDHLGNIWVGTSGGGLNRYDRSTNRFTRYRNDPDDPGSLSDNDINTVFEDRAGRIWIGARYGGLNRFNRSREQFFRYLTDPNDPNSLNDINILSLCEDRSGNLWIGTFSNGLNRMYLMTKPFLHYQHDRRDPGSLISNDVRAIREDRFGNLWIGTFNGLNRFDRSRGKFFCYQNNPNDPNSLSSNQIYCISLDRSGDLWIGTFGNGLNHFNTHTDRFIRYRQDLKNPNSLSDNQVNAIMVDQSSVLWIATDNGLNQYDHTTRQWVRHFYDPDDPFSLSDNDVRVVYEDRSRKLWIGTRNGGLNRFDRTTKRYIRFQHDPENPNSLSDNRIFSIHEDRTGILWIGTRGGGLNRFDPTTEHFVCFTEKDGLPNNVVYGILEDDHGILWLSTNNGLSKFNPTTEIFKNYNVTDGLQSNEFNFGAFFRSRNGEMFFGGINGFNTFHPDSIKDNPHIPPIVITDFQIFNKSVPIGDAEDGHTILKKSITETEAITLSYTHRVVSFEFAALHYAAPEKNQYKYILEGFEQNWNEIGNRRFATYTNLPPGDYVFRVKGSNNDGVWNEEGTSMTISVTPPFWHTLWFRGMSIIVICSFIVVVYQVRTRAIRNRSKQLEKRVEARSMELSEEISERKRAEEEIEKRQKYLESVLNDAPDAIVATDGSCRVTEWNPGAERIFGYTRDEVFGQNIDNLIAKADKLDEAIEISRRAMSEEKIKPMETVRFRKDDTPVNVIVAASPILIGKELHGVVTVYTDITKRISDEESIKASLREKEVLLKEIHHRVKNNLQVICSLLGLQSRYIEDKRALEIFEESRDRVRSMALIHEQLYGSKDFARIDFAEYIKSLVKRLFQAYQYDPSRVLLDVKVEDISLSIETAVPCGLIVNELVSNALKHAFPASWVGKGKIEISLHQTDGDEIELVVRDNGIGLTEEIDIRKTESLGLQLVHILTDDQLGGNIDLDRTRGTKFRIRFKGLN